MTPGIDRRSLLAVGATVSVAVPPASRSGAPEAVERAVARFAGLPAARTSCLLIAEGAVAWSAGHRPDDVLFIASAAKPFTLAAWLKAAEAGRLSLAQALRIDDGVRMPASPVLLDLTGTMAAQFVLEAMILHSDNTAADAATAAVGPSAVRAVVAETGLETVRIPDSLRRLYSHCAGAPPGTDLGWADLSRFFGKGEPLAAAGLGPPRDAVNEEQSWLGSAADLVRWYRETLSGRFFAGPATLAEYRRILAMADLLPMILPTGHLGYGKGGSLDWLDLHALCAAGRVLTASGPVTFCFTTNARGEPVTLSAFTVAVAEVLAAATSAA